jgi:hypothetical protein
VIPVREFAESLDLDRQGVRNRLWRDVVVPGWGYRGPGAEFTAHVHRAVHTSHVATFRDPPPYPSELFEEVAGSGGGHTAEVPASWWPDLISQPPVRTTDVFALGESLHSALGSRSNGKHVDSMVERFQPAISSTIGYLYDVAVQPARIGDRAIHLLSRFGALAIDPSGQGTDAMLRRRLYGSPIGFRTLRMVSRMLLDERKRESAAASQRQTSSHAFSSTLRMVLSEIDVHPPPMIHDHHGLLVECLLRLPTDPAADDLASHALRRQLGDLGHCEGDPKNWGNRSFAATSLIERGCDDASDLIVAIERSALVGGRHLAASLRLALANRDPQRSMTDFEAPDTYEAGIAEDVIAAHLRRARPVADKRAVPPASIHGATHLLRCAALDPNLARRRLAVDTLRHAGLSELTSAVSLDLARANELPEWMRCQSAATVGWSQDHDSVPGLIALATDEDAPSSVRETSLHAIGEIGVQLDLQFGRESLHALLHSPGSRQLREEMPRAHVHAVATARDPDNGGRLESDLRVLSECEDPIVASMARWGIIRSEHRRRPVEGRIPPGLV